MEVEDGKGLGVSTGGEMAVFESAAISVAKLASVALGSTTSMRVAAGAAVVWRAAGASSRMKPPAR